MKMILLFTLWWYLTGAPAPVLGIIVYALYQVYRVGYDVVVHPDKFTR